jgi:hypothetical protein
MYEVFHWGNSECPKKQLPLSIAGSEIIIDRPPPPLSLHTAAKAPGSSYYGERCYKQKITHTYKIL